MGASVVTSLKLYYGVAVRHYAAGYRQRYFGAGEIRATSYHASSSTWELGIQRTQSIHLERIKAQYHLSSYPVSDNMAARLAGEK